MVQPLQKSPFDFCVFTCPACQLFECVWSDASGFESHQGDPVHHSAQRQGRWLFVHTHQSARLLEHNTLVATHYQPVAMQCINFQSTRQLFVGLAKRIEREEEAPGLCRILCKPMDRVFPSLLGYTIKTHKSAGEVVPRPLHKAIQPALEGFSTWLVMKLKPVLHLLCHVIHDSHEFKRRVHNAAFPAGSRMATVDVKDFYLSGSAAEVSRDVSSLFQGGLASLIQEAIFNLLDNQFIYASLLQSFYRCFHGTGMGLKHSGHCANLAFYVAVERVFVTKSTNMVFPCTSVTTMTCF